MIPQTPVEALYNGSAGVWSCLQTPRLKKELKIRRAARKLLDNEYRTQDDNLLLYKALTEMLAINDRLALYIPLHLIRHYNTPRSKTANAFMQQYLESWHKLLDTTEPEANYTNGDLHMTPTTRYIKPAALLAPTLYQKNLISETVFESVKEQFKTTHYSPIDPKSRKWLEWEKKRRSIKRRGAMASATIDGPPADISDNVDDVHVTLVALGHKIRATKSLTLLNQCVPYFKKALDNPLHNAMAMTVLKRLGTSGVGACTLDGLGIGQVNLSGPILSNNLRNKEEKLRKYQEIASARLKEVVYPVVVAYGSSLKGYGTDDSDVDIAVLVRPHISISNSQAERMIDEALPGVCTFWIQGNDELYIADLGNVSGNIAMPFDAHRLFSGAWFGDDDTTLEYLCKHLLRPITTTSRPTRRFVIDREMERDLLQYRLLHRGYETYYPVHGRTFLDDGYRLTATKLALSNVMMPWQLGSEC